MTSVLTGWLQTSVLRTQWRSQGQMREAAAMIQSRDKGGFDQGGGEVLRQVSYSDMFWIYILCLKKRLPFYCWGFYFGWNKYQAKIISVILYGVDFGFSNTFTHVRRKIKNKNFCIPSWSLESPHEVLSWHHHKFT